MWKIDLKEEMNVTDNSGGSFKKSKKLHGVTPKGNKKWSRSL